MEMRYEIIVLIYSKFINFTLNSPENTSTHKILSTFEY